MLDWFISAFNTHVNDGFQYGMGIADGYYKNANVEKRYFYNDLKTFSAFAGCSIGNNEKAIGGN